METPPCKKDPRGGFGVSSIVSPSETKMPAKKTPISTPPQISNLNDICGKMISISPVPDTRVSPSARLSPSRVPPLPCTGGFRLQPRKNISYLTSHPPTNTPSSVTPSRGRKRGANETSSIGLKSVPRRHNESSVTDSPILMHHAMQSMSIRSPTPSTPSLSVQDNTMHDKESPSPFLLFSPSLKPSPRRQHLRCESLGSIESSTKHPSSVVTDSSRVASMYGSPVRKARGSNSISSEHPSTPRSHCHASDSCQDPSTPASIRTLPSPRETPLPRSLKLTPRSRRQRDDLSSESSIFLSPKETLDRTPAGRNERTPIFSFEGGLESLESSRRSVGMNVSPYVPVKFPLSRSSTTSRNGQTVSSIVKESGGGNLRIETRSLLETQDSSSTLDYIIASNARIAAQNCDDSLSDDSDGLFVLTNPTVLAEERDAMIMPPPRPSRRRRMSPNPVSISFDASATFTDSELSSDTHPASSVGTRSPSTSNRGDERTNLGIDFAFMQSDTKTKFANTRYVQKYSSRLEPIESCCSLVGLGLTESSASVMDSNPGHTTPPPILDSSIDSTPPGTPSKTSVRLSRSDADNVHLTIANMAVLHQEHSPSLTACSG